MLARTRGACPDGFAGNNEGGIDLIKSRHPSMSSTRGDFSPACSGEAKQMRPCGGSPWQRPSGKPVAGCSHGTTMRTYCMVTAK